MNTETTGGRRSLLSLPPALRYPKYRAYWLGTLASVSGFQMAIFTQGWVTYELTGSALYLGYVGLSNASAAIALNLVGGVYADKLDKRKLIFFTQIIITSLIFLLGFLTLIDAIRVWHIIAIGFVAGGVNAFDQPARQALYPHLIDRKVMTSAVALNSAIWSGVRIIAPVGAGFVISLIGTPASFFLAGSGFLLMALVIALLQVPRIESASSGSPDARPDRGTEVHRRQHDLLFPDRYDLLQQLLWHGVYDDDARVRGRYTQNRGGRPGRSDERGRHRGAGSDDVPGIGGQLQG